jgi:hypothetical protein
MQHTKAIPLRYVDGDELMHTDAHPFCDDVTCPCYSEAETMKRLAIRLARTPKPEPEDAASADTEPEQTATPTPPRKHRGLRLHVLRKEEEEET